MRKGNEMKFIPKAIFIRRQGEGRRHEGEITRRLMREGRS
jgi:hypothetical protein